MLKYDNKYTKTSIIGEIFDYKKSRKKPSILIYTRKKDSITKVLELNCMVIKTLNYVTI